MDKILLTELTVECVLGVWAWERQIKQPVVLDIEFAADIRKAALTDQLQDAIDYQQVSDRVRALVGNSQFQLAETLAERIARLLIVEFKTAWVRVRLKKQAAVRGVRSVGIEIERSAGDYASGEGAA
jgi:7,8-dihydroneopterin aldolase/epimerase/oxygenase